jgi:hypothetical protein
MQIPLQHLASLWLVIEDYVPEKWWDERIAERRGPQKARVAAAKEMLVIIWYMLIKNESYRTMNKEMVDAMTHDSNKKKKERKQQ